MGLTRPKIWDLDTSIEYFKDPLTTLHQGATTPNVDVGFIFNRANGLVSNVALYWSESTQSFITAFTANTGITDTNVAVTTYANVTTGHHLPGANVTYNLGSPTQRWGTLYLAGNTIDMNGATIGAVNGVMTLTNQSGGSFTVSGSVPGQSTGTFGNVVANSGVASTSTSTGALQVLGGAGITGNLYVGGNLTVSGTQTFLNTEIVNATEYVATVNATNLYASTIGNVGASLTGATGRFDTSITTATVNAATIGNTGATLTGALSTASQPNITTLAGLTSFGTAGVNTSSQGNLTVGMYLTVPSGSGQFSGPYNESTTTSGVFIGNTGSGTPSPRIGFFNGTTSQNWQIDNYGGTFRWFTPGVTRMQLDTNGVLSTYGNVNSFGVNVINSNVNISALQITGTATKGGAGYHDFLSATNQGGGTNPNKYFRLDSSGQLQIINSAYTSNIFNLTDAGVLTVPSIFVNSGIFWSANSNPLSTGGGGGSISGLTSYSSNSSVVVTYNTLSNSNTSGAFQVLGGAGFVGNVTADIVHATNNGNGTNFQIGDDLWLGDINMANAARFAGQQDATQGYIVFGNANNTNYIGRSGTNPLTVTGPFSITGNTAVTSTIYGQGIYDNGNRVLSTSSGAGNLSISGTAVTLPTTGPGVATIGSSTAIPVITTDAYGRISNTTTAAVVAPAVTLTGSTLASGVTASSLTSVGNLTLLSVAGSSTIYGNVGIGTTTPPGALGITNYIGGYPTATGVYAGSNANYAQIRLTATSSTGGIVDFGLPNADFRGRILYAVTGDQMQFSAGGTQVMTLANTANGGATISTTLTTQNHIPSANVTYNLGSSTAWWSTVYGKAVQAQYADLAECYTADADYLPGTVVVFGGDAEITTTVISHDSRVAGVISTDPAYLMNAENGLPVAMTGRVPCLVQGPVTKGQVLVTSTTEGVAQAIDNSQFVPGCVVGKALEAINTNTIETIEVVVGRF